MEELIIGLDFIMANNIINARKGALQIKSVEMPFKDMAQVREIIWRQLVCSVQVVLPQGQKPYALR